MNGTMQRCMALLTFQNVGTRSIKRFRWAWNAFFTMRRQTFRMEFYLTLTRMAHSLDKVYVSNIFLLINSRIIVLMRTPLISE